LNRTSEAFDYLNRAKSKKLQESLRLSSVKSGDKAVQALIDQASAFEKQVQTATAQIQLEKTKPEGQRDQTKIENLQRVVVTGQGDMRRVFEKIKSSSPNWAQHMEFNPKSLEIARRGIPEGVLLVQYAPMADQLYIFLVNSKEVKIVVAPTKPEDLWKKIDTVRAQITSGEKGGPLDKNLIALYDLLIKPIAPELEGIKTMAIIPNQRLFYLPIHALAKKQADGRIRYLIEDKEIVYLAGADVLSVIQGTDKSKSPSGMVAFGNPTGANLPASEQEVRAIAQVFPATEVMSGGDVTKVSLHKEQMLDKRIIHFATHGILDAANPTESYIQLAMGGPPDLARLKVDEIWDLPFKKVTLVTLSACESALGGKDPDGTEITSLAEGFSTAGATTVLASLWSVGDESTKELMVEFYKQLAIPGVSKAAALQTAEIKLLRNPKFSRPLYWAPFILMGDWR
jgi:CHAT domain-containing protein